MIKLSNQSVLMRRPSKPGLKYKFTLEGELNITPYVAKQKANYYFATHFGNLVIAEDPDIEFNENGSCWRVPAVLTNHDIGHVGKIEEVLVDAQTGNIIGNRTTSIEEMQTNAKILAEQRAS